MMKARTYHILHDCTRGAAYLFLLLCFIVSSVAASPQLTRGMPVLVPASSSEELPSEENHSPSAAQQLVIEGRRVRRGPQGDLQAAIDARPARGGTTALTSRPRLANLPPTEHQLRFGLGTPLRI